MRTQKRLSKMLKQDLIAASSASHSSLAASGGGLDRKRIWDLQ
jgi:hypothetical protein